MKALAFISRFCVFCFFAFYADSSAADLQSRVEHYSARYGFRDLYEKRVSNRGEGDPRLYGTRNFREVLKGVLYRGGANNVYHRSSPRDNRNPLPDEGLQNLCGEGFSKAIYLYRTNFESAPRRVECQSRVSGEKHDLRYEQVTALEFENRWELVRMIYENIQDPRAGPIYAHCWNGWHASGWVSALALRQFCGWSAERAVRYWDRNTDGVNQDPRYERVRKMIRDFAPNPRYFVGRAVQERICPKE